MLTLFALLSLGYCFLINSKGQRTTVDQGSIVLFPVGCFITRFRHKATTIDGCSRSDRSFLI